MGSVKTLVDFANAKLNNSTEARLLVEYVSGMPLSKGLIHEFEDSRLTQLEDELVGLIARRQTGEPLQYVMGTWDFRQLQLAVDSRVLIPRPETEEVVGAALRLVGDEPSCVVDLGTGSGAIALSIATEAPSATVHATDFSRDALDVARANCQKVFTADSRMFFHEGSWYDALPNELRGRVNLIVSNPPYIRDDERSGLAPEVVDWEPSSALFAGAKGLDDIEIIVSNAQEWLAPGGAVVIEFAPAQSLQVAKLADQAGFTSVQIGKDMTGRDRWIEAIRP